MNRLTRWLCAVSTTLTLSAITRIGTQAAATVNPQLHKVTAHASPSPSPALLSLRLMAFPLRDGLHINAIVTNQSLGSWNVRFPNSARIEVKAIQDGTVLWDSLNGQRFLQSESSVMMQGQQIATFTEFWPYKPGQFSGIITLRGRLLATSPVNAKPILIDLGTPPPSALRSALPSVKSLPIATPTPNQASRELVPAPGMRRVLP